MSARELLLLALVAGASSCGALPATAAADASIHDRHARQLQQQTSAGCHFNKTTMITTAFTDALGFVLVSTRGALDCFNQVKVNQAFAYESVINLMKVFNDSYVFTAMAIDPLANPLTLPSSYSIFPYKVNLPGELRKLALSWPKGQPVPLGDIQFPVNDLFNRLKDAHVVYNGATKDGPGTILGDAVGQLASPPGSEYTPGVYIVDPAATTLLAILEVDARGVNGAVRCVGYFLTPNKKVNIRTFKTINGKAPMEFLKELASSSTLDLPYKSVGTRVNKLINRISSLDPRSLGPLTDLPDMAVTFADGTAANLTWGVTFGSASINATYLKAVQEDANTPGMPMRALQKAISTVLSTDNLTTPLSDAPEKASLSDVLQGLHLLGDKEEEVLSRRSLQASPWSQVPLTWLNYTESGAPYGFWYINSTVSPSRAVLKLIRFDFQPSDDVNLWWPGFIQTCIDKNVTELVVDVTDNGGGFAVSGVELILGLYTDTTWGDMNVTFDRLVGEDAAFAYANGLAPWTLNGTTAALWSNSTWLQARVDYLNRNASDLAFITKMTQQVLQALQVLYSSASNQQDQICNNFVTNSQVTCASLWSNVARKLTNTVNALRTNGKVTAKGLRQLLSFMPYVLEVVWPYGTGVDRTSIGDPFSTPVKRTRGGAERLYTSQYDVLGLTPDVTVSDMVTELAGPYDSPFSKVLVWGNGVCGSTCALFAQTGYLYSLQNASAPTLRFATYGGTGNPKDSAGTSFIGGDVNTADLLTSSWAYYATGGLLSLWLGPGSVAGDLDAAFDDWAALMPLAPGFSDQATPMYPQSEFYLGRMGSLDIPQEYVFIPTDYHIPVWYSGTSLPLPKRDSSDLLSMYNKAFDTLALMPSPKAPPPSGPSK